MAGGIMDVSYEGTILRGILSIALHCKPTLHQQNSLTWLVDIFDCLNECTLYVSVHTYHEKLREMKIFVKRESHKSKKNLCLKKMHFN